MAMYVIHRGCYLPVGSGTILYRLRRDQAGQVDRAPRHLAPSLGDPRLLWRFPWPSEDHLDVRSIPRTIRTHPVRIDPGTWQHCTPSGRENAGGTPGLHHLCYQQRCPDGSVVPVLSCDVCGSYWFPDGRELALDLITGPLQDQAREADAAGKYRTAACIREIARRVVTGYSLAVIDDAIDEQDSAAKTAAA